MNRPVCGVRSEKYEKKNHFDTYFILKEAGFVLLEEKVVDLGRSTRNKLAAFAKFVTFRQHHTTHFCMFHTQMLTSYCWLMNRDLILVIELAENLFYNIYVPLLAANICDKEMQKYSRLYKSNMLSLFASLNQTSLITHLPFLWRTCPIRSKEWNWKWLICAIRKTYSS